MIHEATDLWFHTLVSLSLNDISSSDILKELERRFGLSGILIDRDLYLPDMIFNLLFN